jgi:hypothetical protein
MCRIGEMAGWSRLRHNVGIVATSDGEGIRSDRKGGNMSVRDMNSVDWNWFKQKYIVKYGSVRNIDGTDLPWHQPSGKLGHKRYASNAKTNKVVEIRLLDINGKETDRREHLIADYWRSMNW